MNDSKTIFTPEQEEKLAKIANHLKEDGVTMNLLYVISCFITTSIHALTDRLTDYVGKDLRSFYGPIDYSLKPLSRLFIAFHLLKTLYLKDNAASVLDQLQQENDRELNRILEVVEKGE